MSAVALGQKRAIIYDRVSTLQQSRAGYSGGKDGYQIEDCRKRAAARSYAVVAEITDVDSGARWEIDGILDVLDRAKRGEYDVLIVSDTSRFARNVAKKTVYEHELRKNGVTVEYLNLSDTDGPEGRFMSNVFGAIDELDRERIAYRTSKGRRQKAESGKVVGCGIEPYGYRYASAYVEAKRSNVPYALAPDETEAAVVRRIYRDIFRVSSIDLAGILTREGVPTPARWTPSAKRPHPKQWAPATIRKIVKSAAYRGVWSFGDVPVDVPPLVDDVTWHRAQERLTERRVSRRGRDMARAALWTLRGRLTCGHCGGALSTNSNPVPGASAAWWPEHGQRRYRCARAVPSIARRYGYTSCTLPTLLAADDRVDGTGPRPVLVGIEELVRDLVVRFLTDDDLFNDEVDAMGERDAEVRATWDERLAIIDAEIASHVRQMERAAREKVKLDEDDDGYRMYDGIEQAARVTLKRLRAERETYVAAGAPGRSSDEIAAILERRSGIVAAIGRAADDIRYLPSAELADVYELLDLRVTVWRGGPDDDRLGMGARVRTALTFWSSGKNLLWPCLLRTSASTHLVYQERPA